MFVWVIEFYTNLFIKLQLINTHFEIIKSKVLKLQ